MTVRRAAVAGTWYPDAPARLTAQVRGHLESAERAEDALPAAADVIALVAPHAGLKYSGPVAAFAYRLLTTRRYDSLILVGPSHYVGFEGVSLWPAGTFDTPLGPLPVDAALGAALRAATPIVIEHAPAHAREHSLEMQLPFLAALAPATPIVPLVMGFQTRETAFALGEALASVLAHRRALMVASSDLSHFYDAGTASALDAQVLSHVDAMDDEGLMRLLEERPDHACGGGPIVATLRAARQLGARHGRVLRYAHSGDVSGDQSSVVGYMAAAVWR